MRPPLTTYRIGMLLDTLLGRSDLILERIDFIMTALATLQAAEAHLGQSVTNAIAQNAVTAKQLADALAAAAAAGSIKDDSGDLQALADDLNSKSAALDAAFNKAADPNSAPAASTSTTAEPPATPAPAAAGNATLSVQQGAQASDPAQAG